MFKATRGTWWKETDKAYGLTIAIGSSLPVLLQDHSTLWDYSHSLKHFKLHNTHHDIGEKSALSLGNISNSTITHHDGGHKSVAYVQF